MKILFVYDNMYTWGGIQTWLIRLAAHLRAGGHEVSLLTRPIGEPFDVTPAIVEQVSHHATVHIADGDWLRAPRSIRKLSLGDADVIVPCNLQALLLAAVLHQHLIPSAKVVVGVFSPREYCWETPRLQRRWVQRLTERLVRRLPLQNLMFSTDGMVRQTGECLGRDLRPCPVLPLAIDTDRFGPLRIRPVDRYKIVSVARLTPYYTHHDAMIRVIRDLHDRGHPFTYHAYGDGETRDVLEAQARRLGVEDAVFFHGTISYDEFTDVVRDALAYIGIGTGLIEAAACGIPALVAIDSHPGPLSYGFIQDTVGNDVGGYVPGHPEHSIAERVLWLASRSEKEYRQVEKASRARAEEFGLGRLLPRFLDILAEAAPFSIGISRTDRLLEKLDRLLAAALWKFRVNTAMGGRHVRRIPPEESRT